MGGVYLQALLVNEDHQTRQLFLFQINNGIVVVDVVVVVVAKMNN
jgi:hypothetical protein